MGYFLGTKTGRGSLELKQGGESSALGPEMAAQAKMAVLTLTQSYSTYYRILARGYLELIHNILNIWQ